MVFNSKFGIAKVFSCNRFSVKLQVLLRFVSCVCSLQQLQKENAELQVAVDDLLLQLKQAKMEKSQIQKW